MIIKITTIVITIIIPLLIIDQMSPGPLLLTPVYESLLAKAQVGMQVKILFYTGFETFRRIFPNADLTIVI